MTCSRSSSFGKFIGRILLSVIFLASGFGKFIDFEATANYMTAAGLTLVPVLLIIAALVEILGGLSLLLGYKARIGSAVLILFLIPVTGTFHDFWHLEGMARHLQIIEFLKNLGIIGGLFYVLSTGPGCFSLCKCSKENCSKEETVMK